MFYVYISIIRNYSRYKQHKSNSVSYSSSISYICFIYFSSVSHCNTYEQRNVKRRTYESNVLCRSLYFFTTCYHKFFACCKVSSSVKFREFSLILNVIFVLSFLLLFKFVFTSLIIILLISRQNNNFFVRILCKNIVFNMIQINSLFSGLKMDNHFLGQVNFHHLLCIRQLKIKQFIRVKQQWMIMGTIHASYEMILIKPSTQLNSPFRVKFNLSFSTLCSRVEIEQLVYVFIIVLLFLFSTQKTLYCGWN